MTHTPCSNDDLRAVRDALLRSARSDHAPARLSNRVLVGIGMAGMVTASVSQAAAAGGIIARLAVWKWFGVGITTGLVSLGAWKAVDRIQHPPTVVAAVPSAGTPNEYPPLAVGSWQPSITASSSPAPQDAPPYGLRPHAGSGPKDEALALEHPAAPIASSDSPVTRPPAGTPSPTSLLNEVALLEEARRTLLSGDATGALRILDRHAQQFPSPQLGQEAAVLRIEALARKGDCRAAASLADQYSQAAPRSSLARKAYAVLQTSCGNR